MGHPLGDLNAIASRMPLNRRASAESEVKDLTEQSGSETPVELKRSSSSSGLFNSPLTGSNHEPTDWIEADNLPPNPMLSSPVGSPPSSLKASDDNENEHNTVFPGYDSDSAEPRYARCISVARQRFESRAAASSSTSSPYYPQKISYRGEMPEYSGMSSIGSPYYPQKTSYRGEMLEYPRMGSVGEPSLFSGIPTHWAPPLYTDNVTHGQEFFIYSGVVYENPASRSGAPRSVPDNCKVDIPVIITWRSQAAMKKNLQVMKYLDLDTKNLYKDDVYERPFDIQTIAGDLHANLEGLEVSMPSRSASPVSSTSPEDESSLLMSSKDSDTLTLTPSPDHAGFKDALEEEDEDEDESDPVHHPNQEHQRQGKGASLSLRRVLQQVSPGHQQVPSPSRAPITRPTPLLPAPIRTQHPPVDPLRPFHSPWSPAGQQHVMTILRALDMSLYTPVTMLERYLARNPSIIWHAAALSTPLPTAAAGDSDGVRHLLTTGPAAAFNVQLYEALREVAWQNGNVLHAIDIAAHPVARLDAIQWAMRKRKAHERGIRRTGGRTINGLRH
ncbi:hypothetical protein B0T10DRAFT_578469 [Thelonectria olida]|uniref:Uncharacterized protein n=1 Tax=Thelonectria olida TaxID=1576542 RepID=A0A9P9AYE1_9HYPO|nr:hypothetical protein B0T10DRAFT_578469 [Thelonectria olida]